MVTVYLAHISAVWGLAVVAAVSLLVSGLVAVCVLVHVRRGGSRSGRGPSLHDASRTRCAQTHSGPGRTTHDPTYRGQPITVLKPLKGASAELYGNLASLARQDYPSFELLFGVEDPGDPAVSVVERLRQDFPEVRIELVTGAAGSGHPPMGRNPKVRNLAAMTRRASHGLWLISDADVSAPPNYLADLAAERAATGAGLISHPLIGEVGNPDARIGAILDGLHLGSFVAGALCAANRLGHPMVVGKSMLFDRRDLEAVGGWQAVADVLAEDYILGMLFAKDGHRVALARTPLTVVQPHRRVSDFLARHLRWSQMRRWISPLAYLGEPLLNPTPWLLATAAAAATTGRLGLALAAIGGLITKIVCDAATVRHLAGRSPALHHLALIPLKDVAIFAVWLAGWMRRTVDWHGNRLRLGPGSRLLPRPTEVTEAPEIQPVEHVA